MLAWMLGWSLSLATLLIPSTNERLLAHYWLVMFMMVVSLIQAVEGAMWYNFNHANLPHRTNLLTRLVAMALWLQPLTHCVGLLLFGPASYWLIIYVVGMSFACLSIMSEVFGEEAQRWTTFIGPNSHLVWCAKLLDQNFFTYTPLFSQGDWGRVYQIGLLFPIFFFPDLRILILLVGGTTFLYARSKSVYGEIPSHWCILSVSITLVPFVAYLLSI